MVVSACSTETIALVNGVPCRCWQAETEDGVQLYLMVAFIAVELADETPEIREAMVSGLEPVVEFAE